jgi:Zn-dependent oligopeptidase
VEAEIARILGKNDWNEVVLEARSAVTGKPVNELVEEFNRKLQAKDAAVLSGLDATRAKAVAGNARPNPKAAPAGRRAV